LYVATLIYFHLKSLRIMKKRLLLLLSMALLTIGSALAQRTITGLIKDDKGEAMVGASVVVKGTTTGTITDIDGKFSLNVPKDAATLVVSFTGFETKELALGASNTIDVTMAEGKLLEEAVVTAFGIKKDKSNLGYGVSNITSEDLTMGHTTNVTNSLSAKVAGIRVSGAGGSFSSSGIIIRGYTSFTGSNQPLFVVDGVSVDNSGGGSLLQNGVTNSSRAIDLNQDDIESVSVLKGAAATSLYGSRASNGVILITTKSGKSKEKQTISYSFNYANQDVNRLPDYQNAYGAGNTGVFNPNGNSSWGPKIDGRTVALPTLYRGLNGGGDSTTLQAFPNNVKDLFRTGANQQHNLSFQGGKDKFGYRLSLGYLDDKWVLDGNRLQRYNIGFNGKSEIAKNLTASISVNYSYNQSIRSPQGNQLSNPLFRTWFVPRSWDLTGRPSTHPVTGNSLDWANGAQDNPYWSIANNLYNDQVDRVFGNFDLRYQVTDWLTASVKIGADNFSFASNQYDQIGAVGGAGTGAGGVGGIDETRITARVLNTTALLTAQKKFGDIDLSLVYGNEVLNQYRNLTDVTGYNVVVRNFRNLNANTTQYFPFYNQSTYRLIGNFANVTAAYKNWGSVDLAARNDQNSILPAANNSYTYYSAAVKANLMKIFNVNSHILNEFSIRANTGLVGSAKPDFAYRTDTYYGAASASDGFGPNIAFPFNGLPGFTYANTAGNPNLKPEFTRSDEVGVNIDLFDGKINIEANAYQQKSTEIIFSVPNSNAAGITNVLTNAGVLTTKGYEALINFNPFKGKDFEWRTSINYTQFKSVVDKLAPGVANIFLAGFTTPNIRLVAGDEYGQIYGSDYNRTNTADGKYDPALPYNPDGKVVVNGSGLPTATNGVQKIGNPNPKFIIGINNEFSYKGINLNVLFDIKEGGEQYSRNVSDLQRNGVAAETAVLERLNADGTPAKPYVFPGVKADGTVNDIPITSEQFWGNSGTYASAKGFIRNTSWFRVREAALTYTLPKKLLKNSPFGRATLGIFGRNLFLLAPGYPHLDPEQNALGVSNAQGLEFNAQPQLKSLGFNLSVTF
jgi:TonB-linked SusC/RagA family outer membrane protein